MIVLVDLDGTVVNWGASWNRLLDRVRHLTHLGYDVPKHEKQTSFNLKRGLDKNGSMVVDYLMDNLDYAAMEPLPGAVEALHEMVANGYTVRLLSTPTVTNPKCASDKYNWVAKHLGKEWAVNLILTHDKTLVHGDVLFDDKPQIQGIETPVWVHVKYSQPYNIAESGLRIDDWRDWEDVLGGMWW